MRKILIAIALTAAIVATASDNNSSVYRQIIKNNPTINKTYAKKLSNLIKIKSEKYGIPAKLYTAILMQESSYRLSAVNKKCAANVRIPLKACKIQDLGISQINVRTIASYDLDSNKLREDLKYSVEAGAKVLAWFHKTYSKREPKTWFCRYNTGTAALSKIKPACDRYIKLVQRWH